MSWSFEGEYLESCNCEVLCPCITSSLQGPGDEERCLLAFALHIARGSADGVSLDGISAVLVCDSPQVMAQGGWRVAIYLDERAGERQREALVDILAGRRGGPPAMLASLIGELLGVRYVPIEWSSEGRHRAVTAPGIFEFELEGITAPGRDTVMEVTGVAHSMGSNLPIARSRRGAFADPESGLPAFDNSGRNGHYRSFRWSA
jgi:hypothetical protein